MEINYKIKEAEIREEAAEIHKKIFVKIEETHKLRK